MKVFERTELSFPLEEYGYVLKNVLNNKNRWHAKLVCNVLGSDLKKYVSTTYANENEYLRLIETTTVLKCNGKLSPKIVGLYSKKNTAICEHIGEFLANYLLTNPEESTSCIIAISEYLVEINSINQEYRTFMIPDIIKTVFEIPSRLICDFNFLPKTKAILPKLESSRNTFIYGCGIEDPHIWNFRIIKTPHNTEALTTDFDYFTDKVNIFWELGYLYATFRWLKKGSFSLAHQAEDILCHGFEKRTLKSEFMFWLGALSSYCGYTDSIRGLLTNGDIARSELQDQYQVIKHLDKKVAFLADELLTKDYINEKILSSKTVRP